MDQDRKGPRVYDLISLFILVALLVGPLLLTGWAFALLAGRLGAERTRFRTGLMAASVLLAVNVAVSVVTLWVQIRRPQTAVVTAVVSLLIQMVASFLVLRRTYRLSSGRTLAPLAAYLVISLNQLGLALFVIRPYMAEGLSMTGRSMSPALEPGDCIMVNKLLRPRRWDLVAYWTNDEVPTVFCFRLVGLPGERLRFDGGDLYIDDVPVLPPAVVAGRYHASPAGAPPSTPAIVTAKRSTSPLTSISSSATTSTVRSTRASKDRHIAFRSLASLT